MREFGKYGFSLWTIALLIGLNTQLVFICGSLFVIPVVGDFEVFF